MFLLTLIGIALVVAVIFGPQVWVKWVIQRHSKERIDFPGTGGELAEHLASEYGLDGVRVEMTDQGDHYDPQEKIVKLTVKNYQGKSVSAVAIAAHEIGHAIQDFRGDRVLKLRQNLVRVLMVSDRFASVFFLIAPILGLLTRSPSAFLFFIVIGIGLLSFRLIVHLVTLPVEMDASFGKALPLLEYGGYLSDQDMPAAREVLRAAALTYVSVALASLLDLARWIRFIR